MERRCGDMALRMKKTKVFQVVFAVAIFAVAFVFLPPGSARDTFAQAPTEVKVGYLPVISYSPLFVAIEKGFFKEVGIEVNLIRFASGGKMIAPLATGELEVATGSASAGLFNAIAQGQDFKIVADKGQSRKGHGYDPLVVRKDLVDTGKVKSVKDLKGMKVAFFAKGIAHDFILGKMAEEVGLTIKDFDITYLDGPKQILAFENKSIDAAVTAEPWAAVGTKKGVSVVLKTPDEVKAIENLQIAMIMYSGKFIREKRDLAQKFMDAYVKGIKYHNKRGMKDKEILDILTKYTGRDAETIVASIPFYLDDDGIVDIKSLSDIQDWLFANGYMPEKIPMEKAIDLSFLKKK